MAHYAKVLNGKIINVMRAEKEFIDSFIDESPGEWIQTSFNTRHNKHYKADGTLSADQKKALRGNYASIGGHYDKAKDVFYDEKPYDSWVLSKDWEWVSPKGHMPNDGKSYQWNETDKVWEEMGE